MVLQTFRQSVLLLVALLETVPVQVGFSKPGLLLPRCFVAALLARRCSSSRRPPGRPRVVLWGLRPLPAERGSFLLFGLGDPEISHVRVVHASKWGFVPACSSNDPAILPECDFRSTIAYL